MKIIIVKNASDVGTEAAKLVIHDIQRKKGEFFLGLASGKTMIPFYRNLVRLIKRNSIDTNNIVTFNLDEYVGLNEMDKGSLRYFMEKNFFDNVNIKRKNIYFLNGKTRNILRECRKYEREIMKLGGVDLQILGIGRNGHIGFNEPMSSFKSRTRGVLLSKMTREDNVRFFGSLEKVPQRALTMGIATIMKARRIILLASGKQKAKAVALALKGRINEEVPASILQRHKDVIFVLDAGAAENLNQ